MKIKFDTEDLLGSKVAANFVDYVIFFFVTLLFYHYAPQIEGESFMTSFPYFLMWFIIFPVFESISGQTIGYRVFKIRSITLKGQAVPFWRIVIKRLFDPIDYYLLGTNSLITLIRGKDIERRVGDMASKTMMINGGSFTCNRCREFNIFDVSDYDGNKDLVCNYCGKNYTTINFSQLS